MSDRYLSSLLSEQEKILLVTRQHWFILFRAVLVEIILAIVIIIGVVIATTLLQFPLAWLGLFLLIIPAVSFVIDFLNWSNEKYVLTSRRVIHMRGIYNKTVTDSSLEKVNDVKMTQSFWGRMFDFGDIEIMTASELGANLFRTIGNPIQFKTAMLNAKETLEQMAYPIPTRNGDEEDIPTLIAKFDNLRKQGVITEEEFQRKKNELLTKT